MAKSRRSLRRAQSWRWEPADVEATIASETARQHWDDARASAIAWAVETAYDSRVVYLDTETTGFGPRAEIVDIAVVSAAGQVLLESLVRPERHIPTDVIAIHGITDADVRDAPTWCDLYERVREVLEGRRVVVYNVTFDRQMVDQACGRYALAAPAADWDCAMKKYARYHGNWDPKRRWYKFQKLERAVIAFGAEPGGHRAAADAFACRTVVLGMAATPPPLADPGTVRIEAMPALPSVTAPSILQKRAAVASPMPAHGPAAEFRRWASAARELHAELEGIPANLRERSGACGEWSPREVAAHCAGWEWEAARRLRVIATDPDRPEAVYDVDGFNAASVQVRANQDWARTLEELAKASNTLATAACAIPDDARTQEWLTRRATDFEEHAVGLRRWLDEATAPVAVGVVAGRSGP